MKHKRNIETHSKHGNINLHFNFCCFLLKKNDKLFKIGSEISLQKSQNNSQTKKSEEKKLWKARNEIKGLKHC